MRRVLVGLAWLEAFAGRVRDQIDLAGVERGMAATIADTLRPSATARWIRGGAKGDR